MTLAVVRLVAGIFILVSLALGVPGEPAVPQPVVARLSPSSVGAKPAPQSGLTCWCLMERPSCAASASSAAADELAMHGSAPPAAPATALPTNAWRRPVCGCARPLPRRGPRRWRGCPRKLPPVGDAGAGRLLGALVRAVPRWRHTSPPRRVPCATCASRWTPRTRSKARRRFRIQHPDLTWS